MSIGQRASADRDALIHALDRAMQLMTGQSVLFSQTVAGRLRMHPSDLEALGFLLDEGPVPAGRLAEVIGLTSGAVTRMIDRLERGGYVQRELDPKDRRRVIVRVIPERCQEAIAYFEPMRQAAHEIYTHYTDEQLVLILDVLQRSLEVGARETSRLQTRPPTASESESDTGR